VRAFELVASKATGSLKIILDGMILHIKSGGDITSAFESHEGFFPSLFVDMIRVGEESGNLPEVLKALAAHYENNIRLRKDFVSQITAPLIQLTMAILVIAALILILGWIAESTQRTTDVLGWGLLGEKGAMIWLGGWAMAIVSGVIIYQLLSASLAGQKAIHRFLMNIPVLGSCMKSFAIARFSWAYYLTQQAGIGVLKSLDASLRATSNGAFIAAAPGIIGDVKEGHTLSDALERCKLFPIEFIEMVMVSETSGTVPEALERLSPQFEEDARRSLKALTAALGWLIWLAVAGFIVFIVFTIVLWYLSLLNDALNAANRG
jgi:type IV pilus assembly protein PilC